MIGVLLTLVVFGVVLWLVETYIPLSAPIRTIIRVVLVLFLIIWLLQVFGLVGGVLTLPRVR